MKQSQPSINEKKKGFRVWRPASMLEIRDKEPGYHYRWVNKEPINVSKKVAEGWEFVDTSDPVNHKGTDGRVNPIVTEYKTLRLMKISEELREAREAYYDAETDKQSIMSPKQRALQNRVPTDGESIPNNVLASSLYDPQINKE